MTDRRTTSAERAYVLHAQPYRETSLLLETFCRSHGRVAMVARGARRPRSLLRGVLLAFQPVSLAWFGRSEVRTLANAEWLGGVPLLHGEALLCGYYLNELLVKLLPREDSHESLFDAYQQAVGALARAEPSPPVLRGFEKALLSELGYAIALRRDGANGREVDAQASYVYDPDRGPVEVSHNGRTAAIAAEPILRGQTLLDIARDDYSDPQTLAEAKSLMRALINHRLDYQPLSSRRVFRELLEL
jgi:DNA repair protein RecO (recombination protein O)